MVLAYWHIGREIVQELQKACRDLISGEKLHKACGVLGDLSLAVEKSEDLQGFSPLLSWSHYRT
jgi:hypothetical protein